MFCLNCSFLSGQLTIKAGFSLADHSEAEKILIPSGMDVGMLRNNYHFGLAYQYIFEGTGMSVLPGLSNTFSESAIGSSTIRFYRIGFELPFKFFPFNMEGDCNCPDFSIRNKFFEKHFFIMLNPGINFNVKTNPALDNSVFNSISYKAGIGAGLSVSAGKRIILSPSLNLYWFFGDKWNTSILNSSSNQKFSTSYSEAELELRLVYKFRSR